MARKKEKALTEEARGRAVLCLHFSSESQTEQSIEGQRRGCMESAKTNGHSVVGEYVDRARSATTDERPGFQRLIADSYSGEFDAVLVWKSDRFARQRYDAMRYRMVLRGNGVRLLSATEPNIEGPERILMESVSDGWNEYYSAELSRKVKRGLRESVAKGKSIGGYRPLGYRIEDGRYAIDEGEAEAVREIYRLYVYEGMSMAGIARRLAELGLRRSDGRPINHNAVEKVLASDRYVGVLRRDGAENRGAVPRLVGDKEWQRS